MPGICNIKKGSKISFTVLPKRLCSRETHTSLYIIYIKLKSLSSISKFHTYN